MKARFALFLLPFLTSASVAICQEKGTPIPNDKALPSPEFFGDQCAFDMAMLDGLTAGFVEGRPFVYDEFPYTALFNFKDPEFEMEVYYWQDSATALDSFKQGKQGVGETLATVSEIKTDGPVSYFTWHFFGDRHCCSMVVGNVHFVLAQFPLGTAKDEVMKVAGAYRAFLEKQLPESQTKEPAKEKQPLTVAKKWKGANGKEVAGSLSGYDPEKGTVDFIREADNKRFKALPIATFSEEEQKFIAEKFGPKPE